MKIEFSPIDITDLEIAEVVDTLKSGWITTGPKTKKFEEEISKFCGTKKAVCLNSATACMELALRLFDIKEGDEVITSAYTYTASASVIAHTGAKIVLIDTKKDSFEMDYDKLGDLITEKTKAIIPVDLAGVICNYAKIYDVVNSCKDKFKPNGVMQETLGRILVLADGAHSFGATQNGLKSGQIADFTSFSFHAVKNLTTGEGGAITWKNDLGFNNDEIYKQFMLMSLHGQNKDALSKTKAGAWEYDIIEPFYKCNMTDISASIGLAQLKRYNKLLTRRSEIVKLYEKELDGLNIDIIKHYGENFNSSCHLLLVRLCGKNLEFRNKFIEKIAEKGVSTNVHYKPLPLLSAYQKLGFNIEDYKNSYEMYENEITLPVFSAMTDEQVLYVCDCFKKSLGELSELGELNV